MNSSSYPVCYNWTHWVPHQQCLQRTFILRLRWKLCTTHKFCKHLHCFQHLWATCLKPCPIWPLSVKSNLFLIFKPLYFRSIRCERFWSWELSRFPLACELGGCKAFRDDVEVSRYIFVLNACHVKWNEINWSGHIHEENLYISGKEEGLAITSSSLWK